MATPQKKVPLPGSARAPLAGARATGAANPEQRIEVTLLLRPRSAESAGGQPRSLADTSGAAANQLPAQRQYLSREEFEAGFGASPEDVQLVEDFAHEHSLDVVEVSLARRSVVLSGTVAAFKEAFEVELQDYEFQGGRYRGRSGPVHVPAELEKVIVGVFGLDDRPQAQTHFRLYSPPEEAAKPGVAEPRAVNVSYTPPQLAKLYNFPTGLNGQGQTIAIIELGGGYRTADLKAYFSQLGVTQPRVTAVAVDGAHNKPTGNPNGPDGEVLLDIEVAGAVAPGARIAVYFAPNTDRGFLDAITTAVHDKVRKPSIISISWGGPESSWTSQALQVYNQAFQEAASLGVTICCASGDNGSSDGVTDGKAHVDFPASSPFVLACGGTKLLANANAISSETVWNEGTQGGATGGGVSETFPLPAWQQNAHVPPSVNSSHFAGRGVPDVSGDADPATGYLVRVDGKQAVIGGTSAVAPLWAGLLALINQKVGKPAGYLNPLLYQKNSGGALRDITGGNNGAYQAKTGWDACTGLGSPDGVKLLNLLSGQ